jgi:pimeloyl-ACP methyl ester carboxylesterase
MTAEPTSQFYYSHRLKLHFWDWGNYEKPNLIFVHGGMDHARSWDRIVETFQKDFHVLAPDLRGHGDSFPYFLSGILLEPQLYCNMPVFIPTA